MLRILRAIIPLLIFLTSVGRESVCAQAPSAGFFADDTVVCINNSIAFTDTSIQGGSNIVSWAWTFGDGGTSALPNPTYFYTTGGIYPVQLIVTDNLGLKDTATSTIWVIQARAKQNIVRICTPATSATINAFPAVGPGVSGVWFTATSAVITNPTDSTTLVSNLSPGTYIFYWVVSDGICSAADQVTVFVDTPVNANAGPDQQVCTSTGTATLAGNSPTPGTGQWTTTSTATITSPSVRNTTVTGLTTPGTYSFVWTITRGACVTTDTMSIVVSSPVIANAGTDLQSCSNNPVATLTGNSPSPGSAFWSTTSSASIASPTAATTNVSGLAVGVNTFIYTITNGACVTRDTVQATVLIYTLANAGADIQVCTTEGSASVAGNTPAAGSVLWTAVSSGIIADPTSPTTIISGLTTPGLYSFVYTITNGICVSSDTVVLIVRSPIIANAGADLTLCAANTATLTGNSPAPGTAVWTTTGTATITTPATATTSLSNLTVGSNAFIYSITYGACVSLDTVLIRVDSVIVANAGPDQSLCATTTTALSGNAATPGTGVWTTSGSSTITTPSSSTSAVSNLAIGSNTFVWTITNGACITRDTVIIRVDTAITPNAGPDQQICSTIGTVILAGSNPAPGTALWSTTSLATIATPNTATTNLSGFTNTGNYNFIYTITNGSCVFRDTVQIRVDSTVVANAGADQQICQSATSVTLNGNNPSPGNGVWTLTNGGTIANPSSPTSTVTGLTPGVHGFIWTVTNGACITRDTMFVTVSVLLPSDAGLDQTICEGSPTTLSGNIPSPASGLWTTTSSATIANTSSPTSAISGLTTAGTYDFIWTVSNGSCIVKDTVQITVSPLVIANAGSDQVLCALTTAVLSGNNPAPGSGIWTTTGSAVIASSTLASTAVSNLTFGNNTFIWTITTGACVSSDTVVVRVDSLITAAADADQSLCVGSVITISANNSNPGLGTWTGLNGGTVANANASITTVSGITAAGNYNFVWTITNGGCTSSDTLLIVVSAPGTAIAGTDFHVCQVASINLNATAPSTGTGSWSALNGGAINDVNNPSTSVNGLTIGVYGFVWTVLNGSCTSSDTVFVSVDSIIPAFAGADVSICASNGVVLLNATSVSPYSATWSTNASGIFADPFSASTSFSGLTNPGAYPFIWSVNNGACTASDTLIVNVDSIIVSNAGSDQAICESATSVQLAATPVIGAFWTTSGSAIFADSSLANSSVSNLSVGSNVLVWNVISGNCITHDSVVIEVYPQVTVANAGIDGTVCFSNGIQLNANTPNVGTGLWSTSSTAVIADVTNPLTSATVSAAGTYDFVWTIFNGGCSSSDTVIFNVAPNPVVNAGVDQFATSGAVVSLGGSPTIVSGVSPYILNWSPGNLLNDSLLANPTYTATSTQTFIVLLTDSTGCTGQDTVIVYLNNPPVAVNDTAQVCMNGVLIATVLANDYDTDGDSLILSILTPPTVGNAIVTSAGVITYTPVSGPAYMDSIAYVICDNNPAISLCDTAWLFIGANPLPTIAATSTDLLCYSDTTGGINITLSNGTSPYTYNWSNSATTEDIFNVTPGTYSVTVTDSLGCQASYTDTINGPSAPLTIQYLLQQVNCFGDSSGAIDVSVSGGTPGYQYNWNTTDTVQDLANLVAGIYTLLVTDSNGCTLSVSDTILQPDSALTATLALTDVVCASDSNGVAVVTVAGGTPSFSYLWNNSASTDTLTALTPGIYSVTVTDANACTVVLTDTLNVLNPAMQSTAITNNAFCIGGVFGSATVTITGGTAPLQYSWSNGDTLATIDSLLAGNYNLTVTDSAGCILIYSATINDSSSIAISITDSTLCIGDTAVLSVVNYPNIQYQWSLNNLQISGATTSTLTASSGGAYTIEATAVCGVFTSAPVNLLVNALPTADAGADLTVICDNPIILNGNGGLAYSWLPADICSDPNSNITSITTDSSVWMVLIVTDVNGCKGIDSVLVTIDCQPIDIPSGFSPNNDGVNDAFVIDGLNRFPKSNLKIFNRWGSLVYEKDFYDNSWKGISNVSLTTGNELPDGTYYYIFDPRDGKTDLFKGYVIIRR